MNFIESELNKRDLPALPTTRDTVLQTLFENEYGYPVPEPEKCEFEANIRKKNGKNFAAGKAILYEVTAHTVICGKEFSFPFEAIIPKGDRKFPAVIHNDFTRDVPTRYTPAEEIVDLGFALFHLCYEDVTSDDGDFTNGLAGILFENGKRSPSAPGKLQMWAWANRRVLDFVFSRPEIDPDKVAVAGHSRLGKTALLTGAVDGRFAAVISSCAGCSGDAVARGNTGEQISDIIRRFPYWFCENYAKFAENLPAFDQHWLISLIAPRLVLTGAAEEDAWADPNSQYLSLCAASVKWGENGFVHPDRLPVIGDNFDDGNICYHKRAGTHYFSRFDWNVYLNSLKKKWSE